MRPQVTSTWSTCTIRSTPALCVCFAFTDRIRSDIGGQMERVHQYEASCSWRGSTATGYESYERSHQAEAFPARTTLQLSSDPAFLGNPARLNPEQLLG